MNLENDDEDDVNEPLIDDGRGDDVGPPAGPNIKCVLMYDYIIHYCTDTKL